MIRIKISNASTYIFFVVVFSSPSRSSKLNEVLIRSMDQVFDSSNNIIANPIGNATPSNSETQSLWQNEGFISANATQITSSLGSTIDKSTKLLLATRASMLSTQVKDFDHTFLTIKFSSIIGHTEPELMEFSTTVAAPLDDSEETTTAFSDLEDVSFSTSTSPPPLSDTKLSAISNSNEKDKPLLTIVDNPPLISQIVNNLQSPLVKSLPEVTPQNKKIISPKVAPIPPAILKLNADGTDGHQVIKIAIDPAALSKDAKGVPKKFKRSDEGSGKSLKVGTEQISDSHNHDMKHTRRKRELNSEEISQIHKILTFTKNKKSKDKQEKFKPKLKTIQEETVSVQDPTQRAGEVAEKGVVEVKSTETVNNSNGPKINAGKKLPYQTWRASMDKTNRPPGFYVTVDDKVVFDNWIGVWQSSQSPTVMGRWSAPKKNGIWNDTVLLLQFDENPDRNIKVSFEWEPTDPHAYLFLSNISLLTYGANVTESAAFNEAVAIDSKNLFGGRNRNVTLYIVLQTPSQGTEHLIKVGDKPEVVEQRAMSPVQSFTSQSISDTKPATPTLSTKESLSGVKVKNNNKLSPDPLAIESSQLSPSKPQTSTSYTALLVSCFTGTLSVIILIFLIYKKLQITKSPHPIHNLYIDEL